MSLAAALKFEKPQNSWHCTVQYSHSYVQYSMFMLSSYDACGRVSSRVQCECVTCVGVGVVESGICTDEV